MTRSLLLSALVAASAALPACSGGSPEAFDSRMSGFIGRPEAELVASLGVPNRTYDGVDRRLLQYEWLRPATGPAIYPSIGLGIGNFGWGGGWGVGTGLGLGFGGAAAPSGCTLVFESRDGLIDSFSRSGPGCVLETL